MTRRYLRALVGGAALLLGVLLIARESATPTVFERYSLSYFLLVVAYLPVLFGALFFSLAASDTSAGVPGAMRSRSFWLVQLLILLPAAAVGFRFARDGELFDIVRVFGLVSLGGGYALVAISLASRAATRSFHFFQVGVLATVSSLYLAAFLITPLLGSWVERTMGLPAESTFRVTQRGEYDSALIHQPGARFVYTGSPGTVREYAVPIQNNSWGFHDRERSFENPEARPRIVVLGDSYVQALEVPRDSAFPAVIEDRLRAEVGDLEVIRLARRPSGQAPQLELLEEYGAALRPQLVILVWGTNDLLRNDPDLAAHEVKLPGTILFPGLLLDRLATLWLQKRAHLLGGPYRLGVLRPDYWAYLEPTPPPARAAFATTEALLDQIVDACRAIGSDLMIVVKRPTNELRWLRRFPSLRHYALNPDAHAQWLEAYARSRGATFVDLGPPLQAHYDRFPTGHEQQYSWPHGGFLREPGHRLAAEVIHEAILRNGFVDPWRSSSLRE